MIITRFALNHIVSVYVLIIALFIGGFMAYQGLPREAAPDIAIPVVIVSTPYFGVSPADIETLVTAPLERNFRNIRDLDTMTSTSAESISMITLEFDPEVNIEDALQRIRTEVDKARPDLPPDAEDPEIIEINASDWPILVANISGEMDLVRLKNLAEDLQDDLESIPGVLRASLAGGVSREIQINMDPEKLRQHGVSPNQVIGAVQSENINLPGGSIDIGSMTYIVRVAGEFREIEPIRHIIVSTEEGEPVYLRDVADVEDAFETPTTYSRLTTWMDHPDGTRSPVTKPNISLSLVKRGGENIISIAEEAKEVIARYEKMAGNSIQITIVNDMSANIESTVNELENNIISGMLLVLLVLFLFMGGLRNALFVAISVPLSMLITFLVLSFMGVTLNMVVLFALLLALGMLVDNAIVIVENIYRHASEGKTRMQAALDGTTEVGWAIIASTFTTVAAFFPMLFWPGIIGQFMGFLPLTVIITLLSSLFVALVINPVLCATLLKVDPNANLNPDSVPDNVIYRVYRHQLEWALDHRTIVGAIAVTLFVGTFMIFGQTTRGLEFFPQTTPEQFNVEVTLPDGTNLDATDAVLRDMQGPLATEPDLVTAWITDTGTQGGGQAGGGGEATHYGQITVELKKLEEQQSDPYAFIAHLRNAFSRIPGAEVVIQMQDMGPPTGDPISIEIAGEDLTTLARLSQQVRDKIRDVDGIMDLRDNLELTRPEIHVEIDRQRAAFLGLSTESVAQTVRTAIHGGQAGVFREGDDEFDIMVRVAEDRRRSIEDIRHLTVVNPDGFHIPLVEVAQIEVRGGSGSIRRKNQERVVTIRANNADGFLPAVLLAQVQELVAEIDLPAGYEIRYTGEQQDQEDAADFLAKALLAAVFLITLILVTEFNSIVQPFIILFSVLLSLIGVLWSLIITGMPFGIIMTGIGIISLAGIVVNNSIVMIDYINQLRERGFTRRDALVQGGLVRFRPVMLTAATTMLGLLPIVLGVSVDFVNQNIAFGGQSVEMWGPMGTAVTGGLLVATLMTLIVVPVMYSAFDSISDFGKRILRRFSALGLAITVVLLVLPVVVQAQPEASQDNASAVEGEEEQEFNGDVEAIPTRSLDEIESPVSIPVSRTLDLTAARELIAEESFDVQIARTQVVVAEGVIRQAYAAILPTFSASGNYTINQEEILLDFGADDLPPGIDIPESVIQPRTDYRWNLSATVNMNFRSWPMLNGARAQREMALAQVEMTQESIDEAVIQTYFNLLVVRRTIDLSARQVASAETIRDFTRRQVEGGVATDFELTRAELELRQRRSDLDRARQQFIQVRKALAELLQTDDDFDIEIPPALELHSPQEDLRRAESNRAAFRLDRYNEEFAIWSVRDIYYSYLPSLSATFRWGGGKGTALQPGTPQWALVFGAEWILWDGGMREAELDQTRAQLLAAELQREQTRFQVERSLDQARAEIEAAQIQLQSAQATVALAQRSLEQAETSYRFGVASQLDVINARDQYQLARLTEIQEELQLELNKYRLQVLTGGF